MDWWYWSPGGYTEAPPGRRRRRCCSCRELIAHGATVARFERARAPVTDAEADRSDEVPLAPWWMCERCADVFFSLEDLGFCLDLDHNVMRTLAEYQARYGTAARQEERA